MNINVSRTQSSLEDKLKILEKTKFHGNVTIYYKNGQPLKIEYKAIQDLDNK